MGFKLIAQKHPMGCAVASTASLLGKSYEKTLRLFNKNHVSTRGYYLKDIYLALKKAGLEYKYSKVNNKTKKYLKVLGSIVFVRRSEKYPSGHYLLRAKEGWMNPWTNYPKIDPAKAGINKKIPGKPQWVLYKT